MKIRQMQKEDARAVWEIECLSFPDPWSLADIEKEACGQTPAFYLVCLEEERVIGFAGFWKIMDEGHITNVAVHPDFRKKGVGDLLVAALLKEGKKRGIRAFTLEVRVSNQGAIHLYEKHGFFQAGRRKQYYKTEDGLIMWTQAGE